MVGIIDLSDYADLEQIHRNPLHCMQCPLVETYGNTMHTEEERKRQEERKEEKDERKERGGDAVPQSETFS